MVRIVRLPPVLARRAFGPEPEAGNRGPRPQIGTGSRRIASADIIARDSKAGTVPAIEQVGKGRSDGIRHAAGDIGEPGKRCALAFEGPLRVMPVGRESKSERHVFRLRAIPVLRHRANRHQHAKISVQEERASINMIIQAITTRPDAR